MDRKKQIQIQRMILDTTTTFVVLGCWYWRPHWFNPWNLSTWQWILGAIGIRAAIALYDHIIVWIISFLVQRSNGMVQLLPTRMVPNQPVRYVTLDTTSIVYLTINAWHEWIFVQRFVHFLWYSPKVSLDWHDLTIGNTLVAFWILMIVLDVCYAPCHHLLHQPWIYPLIHKHHHRQHFPTRGYLDAGNEHPLEHAIGVLSIWGASLAAIYTTPYGGGVHGLTLFFFFNLHAALAMLNHSPYDVAFDLIPRIGGGGGGGGLMRYSVANHEMHHRKFTVNYAQYCMWYDHFMNTYASYEGPKKDLVPPTTTSTNPTTSSVTTSTSTITGTTKL